MIAKKAEYSGTFFNHILSSTSISNIIGIDTAASNKKEYLHWILAKCHTRSRLSDPSDFTSCGLMALPKEELTKFIAPETCKPTPYAAFRSVPKNLLSTIARP